MKSLFQAHFETVLSKIERVMESENIDRLLIESGTYDYHFLDDQPKTFKSNPHFLYLCPDQGPGHVIDIKLGQKKPELYFYQPDDFWHEVSQLNNDYWEDSFDIKVFNNYEKIWETLDNLNSQVSFISPSPGKAIEKGCLEVGSRILSKLHWIRSGKTDYEIHCLEEANKSAALGHLAAKKAFFEGKSELDILSDYLSASKQRESDMPYGSIVALNQNAAILHYQFPKNIPNGNSFLIDAGARFKGYCSDITRTYSLENSHSVFKSLLSTMERDQKDVGNMVKPGMDYIDIHREANNRITQLLIDSNIIKTSLEEAIEHKLTFSFFPHGIGHPLGLQVHDVCGKQLNEEGTLAEQPEEFPYLRTLRTIQNNDVLTIEPGLYFIPMLLDKLKQDSKLKPLVNWTLVDELIPFGGIRIEDNVVAKKDGIKNLTRPFLP